jgi:hypothetical protein
MKFKSIIIFILVFSAGCSLSSSKKKASSTNYNVQITTIPKKIELNEPFNIDLEVSPSQTNRKLDFSVHVDAIMPAHNHGMTVIPEIVKVDQKHYYVKNMLFHMKGDWLLQVFIENSDSTEVVTYSFELL